MANSHLATYLNDHLAGSEVAVELLRHLEKEHRDTPIVGFAVELRREIEEDRTGLEALMARIGVAQSAPRKLTGWLSEKLAALKLRLDDPGGGGLRLLEIFEALSLGIEGKRLLWKALEAASGGEPELRALDYATLQRRAEGQRRGVETLRLEAATGAFASPPVADKG